MKGSCFVEDRVTFEDAGKRGRGARGRSRSNAARNHEKFKIVLRKVVSLVTFVIVVRGDPKANHLFARRSGAFGVWTRRKNIIKILSKILDFYLQHRSNHNRFKKGWKQVIRNVYYMYMIKWKLTTLALIFWNSKSTQESSIFMFCLCLGWTQTIIP